MPLTAGISAWTQGAVKTTASAPAMGQINRYNATAGSLTVTLPALSGLNAGARTLVQKDTLDVSTNMITFNRAGSDLFDDGSTTFALNFGGQSRTLQVVSISGVKKWKVTEVMGAAGGGGSGLTPYLVDDFGADPTGATFSDTAVAAAITAMGTAPGILTFGAGIYKLNSTKTLAYPGQGIRGQGGGVTQITYMGTGDCFRVWDSTSVNGSTPGKAGPITGIQIYGWTNSNTNICGLHIGDLYRIFIQDVFITGFNTTGSKCFWGENIRTFSERAYIHMDTDKGATSYLFETNASHPDGLASWDFSYYRLTFVADVNQNGITLKNNVLMDGVDFISYFNVNRHASSNTGVAFTVGTTGTDASRINGRLHWIGETSGSGTFGHKDINVGNAATIDAYGSLDFFNPNWVAGTASRFNTRFVGRINGSPSLGKMAPNQSFRANGVIANPPGLVDTASTTHTFYPDTGNQLYKQLLNGAQSIVFNVHSNLVGQAAAYDFCIQQPASGAAGTISSWPGSIVWAAGSAPTLSSTNNGINYIRLITFDHNIFTGIKVV